MIDILFILLIFFVILPKGASEVIEDKASVDLSCICKMEIDVYSEEGLDTFRMEVRYVIAIGSTLISEGPFVYNEINWDAELNALLIRFEERAADEDISDKNIFTIRIHAGRVAASVIISLKLFIEERGFGSTIHRLEDR